MSTERRNVPDPNARFDAELARAARGLVTEELPRAILDAGLAPGGRSTGTVRGRRSVPAFAGIGAALVLLFATAIALGPGGFGPPATPTPSASIAAHGAFRSTLDIRADFMRLQYVCRAGRALSSVAPGPSSVVREGVVCTAPSDAGRYIVAVIVGEGADGRAIDLHVKADLTGPDTAAAREAIAVPLAKAAAIAAADQKAGNALAQWVLETIPNIEPGSGADTELLGFSLKVARGARGGYQLFLHPI